MKNLNIQSMYSIRKALLINFLTVFYLFSNSNVLLAQFQTVSGDPSKLYHEGQVGIGLGDPGTVPLSMRYLGTSSAITTFILIDNNYAGGTGLGTSIDFKHRTTTDEQRIAGRIVSINENSFNGSNNNDAGMAFYTMENAVSTERLRISHKGRIGIGNISPKAKFHLTTNNNFNIAQSTHEGDLFIESSGTEGMDNLGGAISFSKINGGTGKRAAIVAKQTSTDFDGVGLSFFTHGGKGTDDLIESLTINHKGNLSIRGGLLQLNRTYEYAGNVFNFRTKDGNQHGDFRFESERTDVDVVRTIAFFDGGKQAVGINTEDIPSGYTLAVDGKAIMKEVKVEIFGAPDYVFAPDYQLTTLEETASYIKENHHLPEVSSAKEMETNGINLGEMDMLLLKKIEELTLHLIEMKEENERQTEKNSELETRILELELK